MSQPLGYGKTTDKKQEPLLIAEEITKRFAGVTALDGVDLSVKPGQVHAVIGENGAGKSTLMKILAGVQSCDEGQIFIAGKPAKIDSVPAALRMGIALIHQELNLADNLEVGSNIFLGREPQVMGMIDKRRIANESLQYLQMVGLSISPHLRVKDLPIGIQQMVEIAKALSVNARILIMDEPTSSLTPHESQSLFATIEKLKSDGVSIIYISHRLSEITQLADEVTVLRDGANAGSLAGEAICHEAMVRLMVGREIGRLYSRTEQTPGKTVLKVEGLRTSAWPDHPIDLSISSGEIVGIAGLVGAGRSELLETLFGIHPALGGRILIDGKPVILRNNRDAIAAGISLVPENRKEQGLILEMSVQANSSLPTLGRNRVAGFLLNRNKERSDATHTIEQLKIKTPDRMTLAQNLSGGNQQKIVFGKWLLMNPRVLLLDEPTRGVDIGSKQEIYQLMEERARNGVAVLFASSEMEEVIGLSDRVLVMHEGRVSGVLMKNQISEESIMRLATGGPLAS